MIIRNSLQMKTLKSFYLIKRKRAIAPGILLFAILANLIIPLGAKMPALAQGLDYTPRYPERLKYIVSELAVSSEDLKKMNDDLVALHNKCDCKNTTSQCQRANGLTVPSRKDIELNTGAFKEISGNPGKAINSAENELTRIKNRVIDSINSFEITWGVAKQQAPSKPSSKIKNKTLVLGDITGNSLNPESAIEKSEGSLESSLEKSLRGVKSNVKFTASEIKEIKNNLKSLKNLKSSLDKAENSLEDLRKNLQESPEKYKKEVKEDLEKIKSDIKGQISQIPKIPDQLKGKITQTISDLKQQITSLPQTIKNLLRGSGCEIGSPEAFGDPCPNRKEMEKKQIGIRNKAEEISYLRKLLIKEKEAGLEAELKTLREDEAKALENSLNGLLAASKDIVSPALNNAAVFDSNEYSAEKKCHGQYKKGVIFTLIACILKSLGEQDPIKIIFKVGVALKKWELGEMGANIGINLPDKINITNLNKLKDIKINLPDTNIPLKDIPLSGLVAISPSSPRMPELPSLNLSCPKFNSQSYNCQSGTEKKEKSDYYIGAEWYFQTFSWLSEKCQNIPGMKNQYNMPGFGCFDVNNAHLTVVQECDALWQKYTQCLEAPAGTCKKPSGICASLGMSSTLERHKAYQKECANLFQGEKKPTPQGCYLNIVCSGSEGKDCHATSESIKKVLNTLKNKCSQLKEEKIKVAPEPCKFLPLFTGKFEKPKIQTYQQPTSACPSQTISDSTGAGIRLDCPLSIPSVPKIKLPSIKIPDIYLPTFSFMPFFKIKLPNFIFEDLDLPDLELCNLDKCKNIIPSLKLKIPYPSLSIPTTEIPPISLPSLGYKIKINSINFPSLPIPLPQIDLSKLLSSDINLPKISLPRPKITLKLNGVKINAFNMLLGLVSSFINIPTGCISAKVSFIPLIIAFPDYYFYWPKFPEVPDLCNNKYISVNKFCGDIKESLSSSKVYKKTQEAQDTINKAIKEKLQNKLNGLAETFKESISNGITQYVKKHTTIQIKRKSGTLKIAGQDINNVKIKDGKLIVYGKEIPIEDGSLKITGGEVPISADAINKKMSKIPAEINIPWPEGLKASLKNLIEKQWELPSIPLDNLSFMKKKEINIPGFQESSYNFSVDLFGKYPSCTGEPPSGGNPYASANQKISGNLSKIGQYSEDISANAKAIIKILE
jgi:hypothetical protein